MSSIAEPYGPTNRIKISDKVEGYTFRGFFHDDHPMFYKALEQATKSYVMDMHLNRNNDDFSISFTFLMFMLDAFCNYSLPRANIPSGFRKYSKKKGKWMDLSTGEILFDTDPTLYLYWNLRHLTSHTGGIIDKEITRKWNKHYVECGLPPELDEYYEFDREDLRVLSDFPDDAIIQAEDIPKIRVRQNMELKITHEIYKNAKELIFKFIDKHMSGFMIDLPKVLNSHMLMYDMIYSNRFDYDNEEKLLLIRNVNTGETMDKCPLDDYQTLAISFIDDKPTMLIHTVRPISNNPEEENGE